MAPKFIFEMNDVGKTFGEKVVLRNISLSFFYGAKIGVVGENGAGNAPGQTLGYLSPQSLS